MRDGNKLDFVRSDFNRAAWDDFAQRGGIQQARLFQALLYQSQGEARSVDRHVQVAKDVRQRPDMVLVTVGQHNRSDFRAILLQIRNVRNDKVDSQKLGFRKHHARVDDDEVVAEPQHHHVHAELAESAERNGSQGVRGFMCGSTWGLAQRDIDSTT